MYTEQEVFAAIDEAMDDGIRLGVDIMVKNCLLEGAGSTAVAKSKKSILDRMKRRDWR